LVHGILTKFVVGDYETVYQCTWKDVIAVTALPCEMQSQFSTISPLEHSLLLLEKVSDHENGLIFHRCYCGSSINLQK